MLILDFGVFEPALGLQQAGMGKVWAVAQGNTPTAVMVSEHPIRYSGCPPQLESSDGDRPEKDFSRQHDG